MDTESVKLFVLAAEKLNISAAGKELGMAPAVSSARLAKLEKTLGADLLHRSTRKVTLSIEGEDFLPYAKEILAQEESALATLGLGRTTPSGTLRFAAPSSFSQLYIAPILPDFFELYPCIKLDLRLTDTSFDLIEGSFDLALRNSNLPDSNLKGRKLANDRRILCASPDYLLKNGEPNTVEDLSRHQLISFKTETPRQLISETGVTGLFDPNNAECKLVVDDGLNQKIATISGAGISVNSLWSVHHEIKSGSLVRVLPTFEADIDTDLWFVYPKSNVLTAKVRIFIDFLIERIGKSPAWL